MNPNGHTNYFQQTNNLASFDHDISNDNTHQELNNVKRVYDLRPQTHEAKEKSIHFDSTDNLEHGSSQQLFNPPVTLQTRSIFVHSASEKHHKILFPINEHTNNSNLQLNRKQSNQQRQQPNETYMRPKTMVQIQKKYEMSSQMLRHKLPEAILDYIVSKAKLKNQKLKTSRFTQTGKQLSKLGLSNKLSQKYHTQKCNICQMQQPEKEFQKMTKCCSHTFCHSCLHQYVIYKINAFIAVECPNEECHQVLDQDSKLYIELPLDVRKKYKKWLQYEMTRKHPNRRMCPQQNCEGYIEINESIETICSICKKLYCPKCLLRYHEGDCDNQHLQFFQGTLHYRQCNNCKNIIQKSTGCVHMTCRCGYQFCYLCGDKWRHSHLCVNPEQEPIPTERVECCCCEVEICDCEICCDRLCQRFCNFVQEIVCCCGCDCQCCEDCDCSCCQSDVMVGVGKFCILLGFICIVLPFYAAYVSLMGTCWIFITIFIGSTMYTIEYICQLQGWIFIMALIFYPLTMWVGIFLAIRQVFCEAYVENVVGMGRDMFQAFIEQMSCN